MNGMALRPSEDRTLNGLALFAGIGGLELGVELALHPSPLRVVCAVEQNPTAAHWFGSRFGCPVWDDVHTFDPEPWPADIITCGFPCQPFSRAARGRNTHPDLWPAALRIIGSVRPSMVLLENVVRHDRAAADVADLGYAVAHTFFTAAEVGAPHIRRRWFCLGVDPDSDWQSAIALDAEVARMPEPDGPVHEPWNDPATDLRMADGLSYGMAESTAFGNGVVPLVAAHAFRTLASRLVG